MKLYKILFITLFAWVTMLTAEAVERQRLNFNADWELHIGDLVASSTASEGTSMPLTIEGKGLVSPSGDALGPSGRFTLEEGGGGSDLSWKRVTLPFAFNGDEAFRKDIVDLTDTVVWYRKTFDAGSLALKGRKVFIEFEGARQGADVYLNGHHLGFSDNGVMAFGFDLTPYIEEGENVLAVRCDNSWTYRDRVLNSRYQWNDRNFNANYGGLPKNVSDTAPLF